MKRVSKAGDKVWVSCRASSACEGTQAELLIKARIPPTSGGGTALHYRCLKCKKRFLVRY
jgi:hypothetical protein